MKLVFQIALGIILAGFLTMLAIGIIAAMIVGAAGQ